ncbi:hypothetical protein LCGC14_2770420 [marine sediment metagenome]|uniref:SWIM-type domain-containing protein n=1 Tax=marine sediment metagenome TaxID=412755 RepID=A0A0F9B522_9ZZZZ
MKIEIILAWHGGYVQTIDVNNTILCTCKQEKRPDLHCPHIYKIIAGIQYSTQKQHHTSSKREPGSLAGTRLTHSSEDEQ